jgi:hypothetical protein
MLFGYLTLATALIISLSSAVYSILGLTAIFASAFWPIVIMGGSLEIGKIVTTLWLHKYWNKAELQYKVYLCSAVAILMVLTSMGVFGFLSKAHLDQAVPSGDVAAKVQIFDDKIRTQQDNIKAARAALTQMDSAVDQTMSRSTTEQGADKAASLRRSQGRERTALQNDISKAQKEITALQEQRAPIASEMRKVEAEVGPIKYIAALIYGDNPEANVLEKAVRWVIILIVIVFDPLALTLLLAATKTFEWEHEIDLFNLGKKKEEDETPFDNWTEEDFDRLNKSMQDVKEDQHTHIPIEDYYRAMNTTDENLVDPYIADSTKKPRWSGFGMPFGSLFQKKEEPVEEPIEQLVIDDSVVKEDPSEFVIKEARRRWKEDNPNDTLHHQENLFSAGAIKTLPWFDTKYYLGLEADNAPTGPTGEVKGFGITFPKESVKGDMYLRVDQIPSQLYKFNGRNWIEVDKGLTDQHAYDEAYIDHLISKIESGEYDPELLSNAERDAIEKRLG